MHKPKAWLVRRVGIVDRESLARYKKSEDETINPIMKAFWRRLLLSGGEVAAELLSKMWPDDEILVF
jgi:uncharacterized protein (DUF1330 family)